MAAHLIRPVWLWSSVPLETISCSKLPLDSGPLRGNICRRLPRRQLLLSRLLPRARLKAAWSWGWSACSCFVHHLGGDCRDCRRSRGLRSWRGILEQRLALDVGRRLALGSLPQDGRSWGTWNKPLGLGWLLLVLPGSDWCDPGRCDCCWFVRWSHHCVRWQGGDRHRVLCCRFVEERWLAEAGQGHGRGTG